MTRSNSAFVSHIARHSGLSRRRSDRLPMVSRIVAWAAVIDGPIALGRFVRVS